MYVPGALLSNGQGQTPADWDEVTKQGQLDDASYNRLYERRLLPSLLYADETAGSRNRKALITIPGIGCGQFAGKFKGQLGEKLKNALIRILKKHESKLSNIEAVYYDPHGSCTNERRQIMHLSFLVRPLKQGNQDKPQLCQPTMYEDSTDDFSNCDLFSFVAWDHVSWPGNDFYIGSRATDDGVKAAASDSMAVMTGIQGRYNARIHQYEPPEGYSNWLHVVSKNQFEIQVKDGQTAASYGLTYTFGVIGVIVFVKILSRIMKVDIQDEENRIHEELKKEHLPITFKTEQNLRAATGIRKSRETAPPTPTWPRPH